MSALEEAGIPFPSDESLKLGADVLAGAHECYGMAHGHEHIPNPFETENKALEKALKYEKSLVGCNRCAGTGRLESPVGTSHYSNTECFKCNGKGKHLP